MQPNSMLIRMTDLLLELLIGERISGSNTSQVFLNCKRRYQLGRVKPDCVPLRNKNYRPPHNTTCCYRNSVEMPTAESWARVLSGRSGSWRHRREWSFGCEEFVAVIGRPASTTSGLIFPLRNPYRAFPDRPPSRRRDERPPDSEVAGGSLGESSCCRPETCLRGRHGRQMG